MSINSCKNHIVILSKSVQKSSQVNYSQQMNYSQLKTPPVSTHLNHISTQDSLDGQTLVPYQCVVLRSAWDPLREDLLSVEQLQRSAYRRANGGSSAPALQEEAPESRRVGTLELDVVSRQTCPDTTRLP